MQQIGGSIGTALLNTLAASAVTAYAAAHKEGPKLLNQANALVHSYITTFWWSAGIFAVGAVVCFLMIRPGVQTPDPDAAPVVHM